MRVFYSILVGETSLDNARLYREVAQARDQLDIILQRVADGIIVYDSHSKIIYTNERLRRYLAILRYKLCCKRLHLTTKSSSG